MVDYDWVSHGDIDICDNFPMFIRFSKNKTDAKKYTVA